MTKKEINLRIFQKKEVPHPFFQPRIESWLEYNRQLKKLPVQYKIL